MSDSWCTTAARLAGLLEWLYSGELEEAGMTPAREDELLIELDDGGLDGRR